MIDFNELINATVIFMKTVETIYPYAIIEENGYYGIVDNSGNIVIPCVMDDICNTKDEETGLELWTDYYCVCTIKMGSMDSLQITASSLSLSLKASLLILAEETYM